MPEKYPQVRFRHDARKTLEERANNLAKERGLDSMSIPQYTMEASQFFEDNRVIPFSVVHDPANYNIKPGTIHNLNGGKTDGK